MFRIAVVILFFSLAGLLGCTTVELPPAEKSKAITAVKSSNTATIILNRQYSKRLGLLTAKIVLDGKVIGTISNGQCVHLTIPVGLHNLVLAEGDFASWGAAVGHEISKSLNKQNVNIKSGQRLHYLALPVYDSPNVGWVFEVSKKPSGRVC